jgi:hypothetical protein
MEAPEILLTIVATWLVVDWISVRHPKHAPIPAACPANDGTALRARLEVEEDGDVIG